MPPPPMFFNPFGLWIEIVYALIVVLSCFFIYFKTRELYELTSHKGIKYFRNTFLFFGMAYLIRFVMNLIHSLRIDHRLFEPFGFGIFEGALFVMAYLSSMALIYLIYSIAWKEVGGFLKNKSYLLHLLAIIIALFSMTERGPFIFLGFQSLLFILLAVIGYISYRKDKKKKHSNIYLLYLLIFALWIVTNIMSFVVLFSPIIGLTIYAVSVIVFIATLLKVILKLKVR